MRTSIHESIEVRDATILPPTDMIYRITDIVKATGSHKHTILRWEAAGKIPEAARDGNGWRYYTKDQLEIIIQFAKTIAPQNPPPTSEGRLFKFLSHFTFKLFSLIGLIFVLTLLPSRSIAISNEHYTDTSNIVISVIESFVDAVSGVVDSISSSAANLTAELPRLTLDSTLSRVNLGALIDSFIPKSEPVEIPASASLSNTSKVNDGKPAAQIQTPQKTAKQTRDSQETSQTQAVHTTLSTRDNSVDTTAIKNELLNAADQRFAPLRADLATLSNKVFSFSGTIQSSQQLAASSVQMVSLSQRINNLDNITVTNGITLSSGGLSLSNGSISLSSGSITTPSLIVTGAITSSAATSSLTNLTVSGNTNLATASGNVGIGTTAPNGPLHIRTTDPNIGTQVFIENTANGTGSQGGAGLVFRNDLGVSVQGSTGVLASTRTTYGALVANSYFMYTPTVLLGWLSW